MKKLYGTLTLLLILFLVTPQNSFSQFRLSLGPSLGMNFNIHTGSDLKESGSGIGMLAGGQVDMTFSRTVGLMVNMQFYDNKFGSTSTEATEQVGNTPVSFTVDNDAMVAYFQLEPLIKISLPSSGLFFFGGPALGFSVEGSREVVTTITTPGFQFNDGTTKQTSKGSIKDMNLRFEIKAGMGYDIPIGDAMAITPHVSFGYGLTNVVKDVNWKILSISAMATFKFRVI